jgi:DASS family divalent anion:Na+ symporter
MAKQKLNEMGPLTSQEWIMGSTFITLVLGWALSDLLHIDKTAIAFLGLGILMVTRIFTLDDLKHEGSALGTFIWFAILYTLSTYLNHYGFMSYIGEMIKASLTGLSWPVIYSALVTLYVLIHYLFVSQTAHLLALYGVFLGVGVNSGVPGVLLAMMLLFAANFSATITPQGSSANVLFAGSGYLSTSDVYKQGFIVTFSALIIYMVIGSTWILLVS